ncbi:MAG: hypothetical protein HYV09_01705 [Deltaproteobacteria bacterium]|nr:hypothetical protein [Deltaproteobacteria bacterium]
MTTRAIGPVNPAKNRSRLDPVTLGALLLVGASALGARGVDVSWNGVKQGLRDAVARDPLDVLAATVLGGAWAFYQAEHGHNRRVRSYLDALTFISTCLSVGFDKTFAVTAAGKAIATVVQTVGPAMAAKALDPPRSG